MNKSKLFVIIISWLLLNMVFRIINNSYNDDIFIYIISICTLIFFILILIFLKRIYGTFFRIVTFFIITFFLFLQSHVLLNAFSLTENGILDGKFNNYDLCRGILDAQLYLIFFILGTVLVKKENNDETNKIIDYYDKKSSLLVGSIFLLISLPFEIFLNYMKLQYSIKFGYASLYQEEYLTAVSSSIKILSYFFIPSCIYLLFSSRKKSKLYYISIGLILCHAIIELIIGYRASAIVPIILTLYCITNKEKFTSNKTLNKKTKKAIIFGSILTGVVVMFIFPIIRENRNFGGVNGFSNLSLFDFLRNNDLFSTFYDMGKSLQTIIYTEQLVPKSEGFRYGYTYLINLSTAIPNLFWARHPAEVYGSLGKWLTKIVDYNFWEYGGSLGFSCVAEAYINFGYFGIVFMGFIFGYVLEKIECNVNNSNKPSRYASFAIVSQYIFAYPRGEFGDLVRGIFWYMLILLLINELISNSYKKGEKRNVCCYNSYKK